MTDIAELIRQRDKQYGDHKAIYNLVWKLWEEVIDTYQFKKLEPWRKVELLMVLFKTGRVIFSPEHKDHYDDISGYSQLAKGDDL